MTDRGGSKRHPPGKVTQIPVPENMAPPIPAEIGVISYPILDPVRGVALTAAVDAYGYGGWTIGEAGQDPVSGIIAIAIRFEQYLTGEETHGES